MPRLVAKLGKELFRFFKEEEKEVNRKEIEVNNCRKLDEIEERMFFLVKKEGESGSRLTGKTPLLSSAPKDRISSLRSIPVHCFRSRFTGDYYYIKDNKLDHRANIHVFQKNTGGYIVDDFKIDLKIRYQMMVYDLAFKRDFEKPGQKVANRVRNRNAVRRSGKGCGAVFLEEPTLHFFNEEVHIDWLSEFYPELDYAFSVRMDLSFMIVELATIIGLNEKLKYKEDKFHYTGSIVETEKKSLGFRDATGGIIEKEKNFRGWNDSAAFKRYFEIENGGCNLMLFSMSGSYFCMRYDLSKYEGMLDDMMWNSRDSNE